MLTLSEFTRPGKAHAVKVETPIQDHNHLSIMLANGTKPYWSMSRWNTHHQLTDLVGATAIVLAYDMAIAPALISNIQTLDHLIYYLEAEGELILIFPLTNMVQSGQYTRMVNILATMIDMPGLSNSVTGITYMFKPDQGQLVESNGGAAINPVNFIRETQTQKVDAKQYMVTVSAQMAQQIHNQHQAQIQKTLQSSINPASLPGWIANATINLAKEAIVDAITPPVEEPPSSMIDDAYDLLNDKIERVKAEYEEILMIAQLIAEIKEQK